MTYDESRRVNRATSAIGLGARERVMEKDKRRKWGGLENSLTSLGRCSPASFALNRSAPWARWNLVHRSRRKRPEAMVAALALTYLDARLEMFAAGYTTAKPVGRSYFDRVRPLPGNLVRIAGEISANFQCRAKRGHRKTKLL